MDNEKMVGAIARVLMIDGLILTILRATGVIAWPWWVVLLPILVVVGAGVFLLNALVVCVVAEAITRWVRNRRRKKHEHRPD